jgi:prepilin-type N-terminal cleavage/methylation domain-containing protein
MYGQIRKVLNNKDKGFTLIELLVVIIIIGILAAIAIPVFLSQRSKAVEAGEKSDVRTIATEMETYFTDAQAYPTAVTSAPNGALSNVLTFGVGGDTQVLSPGDSAKISSNGASAAAATAYCIVVSNPKATQSWVWESDNGGLQAVGTVACPSGTYGNTVL